MRIVGITGTNGAGKGTIVDYLVNNKGFEHYSARNLIVEEINKRGLENNRDSMIIVANDLRKLHGPAYVAEELYRRAHKSGNDCVLESLRTPSEVEHLRKFKDFTLLSVDAEQRVRYERNVKRGSVTDDISFEKFKEQELKEQSSINPNEQNISKCISMADFVIENNSTMEDLYKVLDNLFK